MPTLGAKDAPKMGAPRLQTVLDLGHPPTQIVLIGYMWATRPPRFQPGLDLGHPPHGPGEKILTRSVPILSAKDAPKIGTQIISIYLHRFDVDHWSLLDSGYPRVAIKHRWVVVSGFPFLS